MVRKIRTFKQSCEFCPRVNQVVVIDVEEDSPNGRALAQCQGLQQTKRSWSWFWQRAFTCTSSSSPFTSCQRKSWAVSTWGLTVPSLPSLRPPFGTRQHTPESFPPASKALTSPSKAGSLSLLRTAVATALLSRLLSSSPRGCSRHSRFTKLLRRDRKMNMGGFQGGRPCPERPLAPSQSGTAAVTSARCERHSLGFGLAAVLVRC